MRAVKQNVIPILAIAIALLITGCSNSQATPTPEIANEQVLQSNEQMSISEQTPSPEELTLPTDTSAVETPESIEEAAYAPILSLYKTALEEHWTRDDLIL